MRSRHSYKPWAQTLEDRVVLSHSPWRGLSVVVSGLTPRQQQLNRRQQPIVAEVNQAFASFTSDYSNARATYFASIFNVPNPSTATTNAFSLYTKQRVSLLANQIISSFLQSPQGTSRAHGQPSSLGQLVARKLINPQGVGAPGSLVNSLLATIPPPGTSSATASLYSLSQDNAIESAQVAVINGVSILKNGDFGNQAGHHK